MKEIKRKRSVGAAACVGAGVFMCVWASLWVRVWGVRVLVAWSFAQVCVCGCWRGVCVRGCVGVAVGGCKTQNTAQSFGSKTKQKTFFKQ